MTIQLRLDTEALAALFPEGSAARVELQSAVIAEFARKHLKPSLVLSEVTSIISRERQAAVNEVLKDLQKNNGAFAYATSLTPDFKRRVREEVGEAVNQLLGDEVARALKNHNEALMHHVTAQMAGLKAQIAKLLNEQTNQSIREAVAAKFAVALSKASDA